MLLEALAGWLAEYRPEESRESEFLERMRALALHPRATERDHFQPGHFTASAFVLDPTHSSILLIHHRKLGIWVQPGGHVDAGDADLLAAARREVLEETGLSVAEPAPGARIFDIDIHPIPAYRAEPAHEHFDVRFAFTATSHEFAHSAEVTAARWAPLSSASELTEDSSVLRAVGKLQRRLG